jgi:hypothetical protein
MGEKGMKQAWRKVQHEKGTALIGAVLVVLILSMLGTVSLSLGVQEIEAVKGAHEEAVARHLAEGAIDLVMQWFHDPRSIPNEMVASLLAKRHDVATGPSFFDGQGTSQFTGTADRPDAVYDASRPADDRVLNDQTVGWFRSLRTIGRILKLKVYGPARPGLLCTVEVTAGTGNLNRTLSVQLGTRTIPPLRSAVQIGSNGLGQAPDSPLPVWAHWGDLKVKGDTRFGTYQDIPVKTSLTAVTGLSYAEMTRREDRWLAIWVGGEALFAPAPSGQTAMPPSNIFPGQDPLPGLQDDRWDYERMKNQAILFGSYYVLGRDGLLYRDGLVEPGLGLVTEAVLGAEFPGDHKGLVFIDTLDQKPPRTDNLGTLSLESSYAEGLFVVNAHVHLKPKGTGLPASVLSPPTEGTSSPGARVPVQLAGVHINGVLYAVGDVTFEGEPRIYGALVAGGRVRKVSETAGHLEVWYNHDLRSGLVQGLPLVYMAPGTWQEKY